MGWIADKITTARKNMGIDHVVDAMPVSWRNDLVMPGGLSFDSYARRHIQIFNDPVDESKNLMVVNNSPLPMLLKENAFYYNEVFVTEGWDWNLNFSVSYNQIDLFKKLDKSLEKYFKQESRGAEGSGSNVKGLYNWVKDRKGEMVYVTGLPQYDSAPDSELGIAKARIRALYKWGDDPRFLTIQERKQYEKDLDLHLQKVWETQIDTSSLNIDGVYRYLQGITSTKSSNDVRYRVAYAKPLDYQWIAFWYAERAIRLLGEINGINKEELPRLNSDNIYDVTRALIHEIKSVYVQGKLREENKQVNQDMDTVFKLREAGRFFDQAEDWLRLKDDTHWLIEKMIVDGKILPDLCRIKVTKADDGACSLNFSPIKGEICNAGMEALNVYLNLAGASVAGDKDAVKTGALLLANQDKAPGWQSWTGYSEYDEYFGGESSLRDTYIKMNGLENHVQKTIIYLKGILACVVDDKKPLPTQPKELTSRYYWDSLVMRGREILGAKGVKTAGAVDQSKLYAYNVEDNLAKPFADFVNWGRKDGYNMVFFWENLNVPENINRVLADNIINHVKHMKSSAFKKQAVSAELSTGRYDRALGKVLEVLIDLYITADVSYSEIVANKQTDKLSDIIFLKKSILNLTKFLAREESVTEEIRKFLYPFDKAKGVCIPNPKGADFLPMHMILIELLLKQGRYAEAEAELTKVESIYSRVFAGAGAKSIELVHVPFPDEITAHRYECTNDKYYRFVLREIVNYKIRILSGTGQYDEAAAIFNGQNPGKDNLDYSNAVTVLNKTPLQRSYINALKADVLFKRARYSTHISKQQRISDYKSARNLYRTALVQELKGGSEHASGIRNPEIIYDAFIGYLDSSIGLQLCDPNAPPEKTIKNIHSLTDKLESAENNALSKLSHMLDKFGNSVCAWPKIEAEIGKIFDDLFPGDNSAPEKELLSDEVLEAIVLSTYIGYSKHDLRNKIITLKNYAAILQFSLTDYAESRKIIESAIVSAAKTDVGDFSSKGIIGTDRASMVLWDMPKMWVLSALAEKSRDVELISKTMQILAAWNNTGTDLNKGDSFQADKETWFTNLSSEVSVRVVNLSFTRNHCVLLVLEHNGKTAVINIKAPQGDVKIDDSKLMIGDKKYNIDDILDEQFSCHDYDGKLVKNEDNRFIAVLYKRERTKTEEDMGVTTLKELSEKKGAGEMSVFSAEAVEALQAYTDPKLVESLSPANPQWTANYMLATKNHYYYMQSGATESLHYTEAIKNYGLVEKTSKSPAHQKLARLNISLLGIVHDIRAGESIGLIDKRFEELEMSVVLEFISETRRLSNLSEQEMFFFIRMMIIYLDAKYEHLSFLRGYKNKVENSEGKISDIVNEFEKIISTLQQKESEKSPINLHFSENGFMGDIASRIDWARIKIGTPLWLVLNSLKQRIDQTLRDVRPELGCVQSKEAESEGSKHNTIVQSLYNYKNPGYFDKGRFIYDPAKKSYLIKLEKGYVVCNPSQINAMDEMELIINGKEVKNPRYLCVSEGVGYGMRVFNNIDHYYEWTMINAGRKAYYLKPNGL
ncbi:MAG: hypothetical protein ABIH39_03125, partial [Candidatus Margulisiibacteriota bacterium]